VAGELCGKYRAREKIIDYFFRKIKAVESIDNTAARFQIAIHQTTPAEGAPNDSDKLQEIR
jgi:hypothetical protein